MEMSVREARAQFAAALAAVERGERVTITKNGKPVAELVAPKVKKGFDWDRADRVRKELGIENATLDDEWMEAFNDPAFSREVLGIGDDWDPTLK
jgi:prevent-host-death family protein